MVPIKTILQDAASLLQGSDLQELDETSLMKSLKYLIYSIVIEHIIQLFNGSAGNRSKYFSRGIGKDQNVLLPEINDRGQYNMLVFTNTVGNALIYCQHSH